MVSREELMQRNLARRTQIQRQQQRIIRQRQQQEEEISKDFQQISGDRVKAFGVETTKQELDLALSYAKKVIRGLPTAGDTEQKRAFEKLAGKSQEFKREIAKGTAGRLNKLLPFQKEQIERKIERPIKETEVPIGEERFVPQGVVREVEQLGGLEGLQQSLIRQSEQRRLRGEGGIKEGVIGFGSGVATSALGTLIFGQKLIQDPFATGQETISGGIELGKGLVTGQARFPEAGRIARDDPSFALGFVAGEIGSDIGAGKVVATTGGKVVELSTRLDPKFKPLDVGTGLISDVPTTKGPKDIEVSGRLSTISEPIRTQAELSGKQVDAVSAQRGLFGFGDEIIVDKPLPTPDAPVLERSFFADPRGRLRPSRLGLDDADSAGALDILAGDVTFKKPAPQALLFPDAKIEKFPSNLADVERKLKLGQSLTPSEQARLLEFQQTPSGQFKPVGFLSKEPEITLPPSEIITRKKTAGLTIINGKRVPIFEVEIKTPTKETAELLSKLNKNIITKEELIKLSDRLSKETGIDYSYLKTSGKFVSPTMLGGAGLSLLSSMKESSSPVSPTSMLSIGPSGPSIISPAPSGQPSNILVSGEFSPLSPSPSAPSPISPKPSAPSPVSPISPTPPAPAPTSGESSFFSAMSKIAKKAQGYDVGVVKGGKPKIIKKGLNLNDARDIGAKRALESLRATFFLRKSNQPAKDIPDTNIFQNNRQFFRKPFPNSKLNDVGEEVWIQKKRKVGGRGSRLGGMGELKEIQMFKRKGRNKKSSFF